MTEQPAFKRDDRVEITGPDDKGNAEYLGLHGRVASKTAETGAFWLHSLEERWYIPGFYPASSLSLLPEVKARPARPAFPTCSTCKHWTHDGPSRGTCAPLVIMPLPGLSGGVLADAGEHPVPVTIPFRPGAAFGCVLHSDLKARG